MCVCCVSLYSSLALALSLTFATQDKLICIDVTATGWAKKKPFTMYWAWAWTGRISSLAKHIRGLSNAMGPTHKHTPTPTQEVRLRRKLTYYNNNNNNNGNNCNWR